MSEPQEALNQIEEGDVVFECPSCSKSLAIDPRGAGLLILCPGCRTQIQVPMVDPDGEVIGGSMALPAEGGNEQIRMLMESLHRSQAQVQEVSQNLELTKERRLNLEELRADHLRRFEKITLELAAIQSSLDQIVTLIENARFDAPYDAAPAGGEE